MKYSITILVLILMSLTSIAGGKRDSQSQHRASKRPFQPLGERTRKPSATSSGYNSAEVTPAQTSPVGFFPGDGSLR